MLQSQLPDLISDFYTFAQHTPTAVAMLDTHMVYIMASNKWCEDYGIENQEVIGKCHYDLFPEILNMPTWISNHKKALHGEIVIEKESKFLQKSGKTDWISGCIKPWYSDSGKIGGIIIFTEIVTDRKNLELNLKKRNAELEKINLIQKHTSHAARIGSWYYNLETNSLTWDDIIYEIHERDPQDIISLTDAYQHYHPDHIAELEKTIRDAIVHNIAFDKALKIITQSGKTVWVRAIGIPERTDGWCTGIRGLFQDINTGKSNEIRLKENVDKLQSFTYIVSHNLRTHTSNLSGLKMLYKSCTVQEEREMLLQQLDKVIDSLVMTVDSLGDIIEAQNTMSPLNTPSVSLEGIFKKVLVNIGRPVEEIYVDFFTSFHRCPAIRYNVAYLESIFLNFITNSIKYKHPKRKPVIDISSYIQDNIIYICFKDNGIGIDLNKNGAKLFGIYNTFHDNKDKKGIGLHLVKKQVESMGGSISVESALNRGTAFTVKLPCPDDNA